MSTVFVIDNGPVFGNDHGGSLMLETGEVMWSYVSSSTDYLRGDLTTTFTERRMKLESLYPNGYEVKVISGWRNAPESLRAAHTAFYTEESNA